LASWREATRLRTKSLYVVMRALYEAVSAPGAVLLAATRLGGLHGYGADGASAPLGGAVTGFAKAYKRERPLVTVKAVDFETTMQPGLLADALLDEALADPGAVEIGYWQGRRYAIVLAEQPAANGQPGLALGRGTVFVVTGAAGGITSAIVADLAANSGGTFHLLDLVALPDPETDVIAQFRTDKEALKQRLISAARAAGERPTPVQIDQQLLAIERQEAALRAVQDIQAAGGTAYYHRCDLRDDQAVTEIVTDIRQRHGRIDVLVHAGGVEISRGLAAKDRAQFDLVFDVKADGLFNLLRAARDLPISAVVAFSSVAGRFGNAGQTDYSAANDLLCKLISSLRCWRPQTRGVAIDWTAWGGLGMATRGSIPKLMEMASIEILPPEAGVPTVRRELTYGGFSGEVVVAGRLGILTEEFDATGGLDAAPATEWAKQGKQLMVGEVIAARLDSGLAIETTLDPTVQPFLRDHALEGVPLLPGVMGAEALAQAAALLAPGYSVTAVEQQRFERPFKFYRQQPQTLRLSAAIHPLPDGDLLAHTTLCSRAPRPKPGLPAEERVHFVAEVRLSRSMASAPTATPRLPPSGEPLSREALYQVYFHGPAYQVLEEAYVEADRAVGLLAANLPPDTEPVDAAARMAPRLIELCFQTAGAWEIKTKGRLALPLSFGSVKVYPRPDTTPASRLWAVVETRNQGESFWAQVVDEAGNVYVQLDDYRTVSLPDSA
jgi:NAD(P)-dependent dehydrogenase (short-subunit alcohol dehydrogenase family)